MMRFYSHGTKVHQALNKNNTERNNNGMFNMKLSQVIDQAGLMKPKGSV